jgi:hypothetical protein
MLYDLTSINTIITTADTTMYKLAERSARDRYMHRDGSLEKEIGIIYDLRDVVEHGKTRFINTEDFQAVVGYLLHKINGFGYEGVNPYFSAVINTSSPSDNSFSGYQLYKQIVVGVPGSDISTNATSYTSSDLVGRYVVVVLDGVILPAGLFTTESYTYTISTGTIAFNTPLMQDRVVQIFTYLPNLIGWEIFHSFTVGDAGEMQNGEVLFSDADLVGTSVAIVVNGLLIPIGLAGVLSYTFNSLTGQILFNQGLSTNDEVVIRTY